MKPRFLSFLPVIGWFVLSFILLTLPGSQLPKEDWFDKVQVDKLVHIFLFGVLVWLAYLPWKENWNTSFRNKALIISFLALDYGIAMEFVQKYYIPNRSFDGWDIVADAVGSMLPFFWWRNKAKQTAV